MKRAIMYETECCALNRMIEQRINEVEMRKLRQMGGVNREYKIKK